MTSDNEMDIASEDPDGFKEPPIKKRGRPKKLQYTSNQTPLSSNQFEDLTDLGDSDDLSTTSEISRPAKVPKKRLEPGAPKKAKPIIIESTKEITVVKIKSIVDKLKLQSYYRLKKAADNKITVLTNTSDDKTVILDEFKRINSNTSEENFIKFHTYTEPSEKKMIFVLKGHFMVDPTELLSKMKKLNIPADSITILNKKNNENPHFLVHFPKDSINLFALNQQHNVIDNLIVRWERLIRSKRQLTQCHNCQKYGHISKNCGRGYRCVKCQNRHAPGDCAKTTKDGAAKCVNCGGDHAANYRKCKEYCDYKEKVTNNVKKKPVVRYFESTPAPWANSSSKSSKPINSDFRYSQREFPEIGTFKVPHQGQKPNEPKQNESSTKKNLFDLKDDFNAIPEIDVTIKLFQELIEELKSTSCHKTRMGFLLRYVMN